MMVVKRPLVPGITRLLSARRGAGWSAYRRASRTRTTFRSEAFRMARLEALGVAQDRAPLRAAVAGRVARGARVEAQAGDHGEGVRRVRVDGDPGALAGV